MTAVPVITIDGPSGSGKGTLCQRLARHLGWHLLDSGAIYRIVGLAAHQRNVSFDREAALAKLAANLNVRFEPAASGEPAAVILDDDDISREVRSEKSGEYASRVAIYPSVRDALRELQRGFAKAPGLVADGRDMGTVVFPDAPLKCYLTASADVRAERRYKQLIAKGESVTLAALLEDIRARDERDLNRPVAPLKPAGDAVLIDSTALTAEGVFTQVLQLAKNRLNV